MLKILQSETSVSCFNSIYIALIPKLHELSFVTDFRPISLCYVLFKLVFKVLTNYLNPLIEKYLSSLRSAFILESFITDNILIAYKLVHSMKHKTMGDMERMTVKLDLSKAYDRVE